MARALDIYNDEVTTRDGTVIRGRLVDTVFTYGGLRVPSRKMLKLVIGEGQRVFVLRKFMDRVERDQDQPITGPPQVVIQRVPGAPGSAVRVGLGDVKENGLSERGRGPSALRRS